MTSKVSDAIGRFSGSLRLAVRELGELHDSRWLVATLSALLSVPWVLFFGSIALNGFDSSVRVASFLAFQLVFAAFALAAGKMPAGLVELKSRLGDAAAVMLAVGVAASSVDLAAVGFSANVAACLAVGASALAACGFGLLTSIWYLPYSRIRVDLASFCAIAAAAFAALLFVLASLLVRPFGGLVCSALYLALFLVARRCVRGYYPAPADPADTATRSDAFVLSSKRKLYALYALSFFTFGGCIADFLGGELLFFESCAAWVTIPVLAVAVLVVSVGLARHGRKSILMTLLVSSFCCIFLGSVACAYDGLLDVGRAVLVVGFIAVNVFYVAYYAGICKRKGFSDARSRLILARTLLVVPVALLLSIAFSWGLVLLVPDAEHAIVFVGQSAMLLVFVAMFYEEVTRTREELSMKLDSVITLRDVRQFALETSEEYRLTDRECEIIQLLLSGRSVSAAAKELYLSESTVKTHVRSIYKKMDVHNRQEMISLVNKWVGK